MSMSMLVVWLIGVFMVYGPQPKSPKQKYTSHQGLGELLIGVSFGLLIASWV